MKLEEFSFAIRPKLIFGEGTLAKLGEEVVALGAKRLLLVIDRGFQRAGGLKKMEDALRESGVQFFAFDQVEPEPWVENADAAAEMGRREKCDLVVGAGGGSAMDVAKAAAVLVTNEGNAAHYQGLNKVPRAGLPKIMIPTTAGTGSEVTFTGVLSRREPKMKAGINSPFLFPEVAILDPLLTHSVPPEVTAATGMDALTHAVEAYTSKQASFFSDLVALQAVGLIGKYLRTAVKKGKNRDARSGMLLGSRLGGIALANAGVTAAHSLGYPLGGLYRISHGVANGLMLSYILEFNRDFCQEKLAAVAEALGEKVDGLAVGEAAQKGVEAVRRLAEDVELPLKIGPLGIKAEAIPELARAAMKIGRPIENNPRPLSEKDAEEIYRKAL